MDNKAGFGIMEVLVSQSLRNSQEWSDSVIDKLFNLNCLENPTELSFLSFNSNSFSKMRSHVCDQINCNGAAPKGASKLDLY
jgi:hypothetical protein